VVLPSRIGEFGLEEKILAGEAPVFERFRDGIADGLLEVVAPLVGRVDAAESCLDGRADQASRSLLLPRRPVEKCWNYGAAPFPSAADYRATRIWARPWVK
jgi:hypothetical protein